MDKIDLKKDLKSFYNPSAKEITVVDVLPMNFIMVDGAGDPNKAQEYADALETLYALSYGLKFTVKKAQGVDYGVMPLEGLWWADDMELLSTGNKDAWKWTAMIMQPECVTQDLFETVLKETEKKKKLTALAKARLRSFNEGRSAQIMYHGPYADEGPTIAKIHEFITDRGGTFNGLIQKHHEIYLGDPRRTAPDKLRTVIRQSFTPKAG